MSKRPNDFLQERVVLSLDHPATSADTTWPIITVPAGRKLRVDKVEYVNFTGLAEDATNVFALSLKNGSTVVAGPVSTDSDLSETDASLVANTFVELTLSETESELVLEAGDVLALFADEGGTATLPAGRVVVHARYVQ